MTECRTRTAAPRPVGRPRARPVVSALRGCGGRRIPRVRTGREDRGDGARGSHPGRHHRGDRGGGRGRGRSRGREGRFAAEGPNRRGAPYRVANPSRRRGTNAGGRETAGDGGIDVRRRSNMSRATDEHGSAGPCRPPAAALRRGALCR